jgi:hypothetical protein
VGGRSLKNVSLLFVWQVSEVVLKCSHTRFLYLKLVVLLGAEGNHVVLVDTLAGCAAVRALLSQDIVISS